MRGKFGRGLWWPQLWCYDEGVDIGVKQAKTDLTKLIHAAMEGEPVVITNHGKPLVRLVPEGRAVGKDKGFGCLKGSFEIPENWTELDAEVEAMFEHLQEPKKVTKK